MFDNRQTHASTTTTADIESNEKIENKWSTAHGMHDEEKKTKWKNSLKANEEENKLRCKNVRQLPRVSVAQDFFFLENFHFCFFFPLSLFHSHQSKEKWFRHLLSISEWHSTSPRFTIQNSFVAVPIKIYLCFLSFCLSFNIFFSFHISHLFFSFLFRTKKSMRWLFFYFSLLPKMAKKKLSKVEKKYETNNSI